MKQLITFLSIIILITASCEKPKDYSCVCKTTQSGLFGEDTSYFNTYKIHAKKREANEQCRNHNTKGIVIWGTSTSCTLN